MSAVELLLLATPLGLLIDIGAVILIVMYGHALFIRSGAEPPDDSVGKDGDLYLQRSGPPDEGDERASRRRECLAHMGVWHGGVRVWTSDRRRNCCHMLDLVIC